MPTTRRQPSSESSPADFRDMLFGDTPLEQWGAKTAGEPWSFFADAREAIKKGNKTGAVTALQKIISTPDLESRQYLVAWNALRQLGVGAPPDQAKRLLGIVIDMPIDESQFDVLACYEDNTARYLNHAGNIVIIDAPERSITTAIAGVMAASRPVVARIGPHDGPRPPAPGPQLVRLSFLTPSGLHFGQGGAQVFMRDPMAGPIIGAATQLLQAVIAFAEANRG